MRLTVTSWNVNSIRMRLRSVRRFVRAQQPDVLCLQETKVIDGDFPRAEIAALGYPHSFVHGMKSYNGVAIFSKLPFEAATAMGWCGKADCRHATVRIDGVELHNLYVPAGGDEPDPAVNPKFAHKLQFLDETAAWFAAERRADRPMILVGDLNIAPLENDVWSHKQLLKVVSHTPVEVERLGRLQRSAGWIDAIRHFVPATEKLYSWWSYRNRDWAKSDRGRRLDHVWVTPPLARALESFHVARAVRGWTPATDHVPVTATLEL
ncbi:MAG TPA: exodeoxyribonuclease III [Candidatus Sulfotelmatobacter sp.]|nr:exodeoxyribonuclease III [Candidatus Sulfotelmatobacter sp.]